MNKNVSYHKTPDQKRKNIRDAWTRTIARPVLSKAIHVCSNHFTEDSFESQELKPPLLGGNLKCILKPDVFSSLFPNGKAVNRSVSSDIEKAIKLRKIKVSLFNVGKEKKCKK